jgi:preprotein translocase subunit SecE
MATKSTKGKKTSTPAAAEKSSVTRIKASDSSAPKKAAASVAKPAKVINKDKPVAEKKEKSTRRNPLRAIKEYFVGAWTELRQVRWPNRRATWGMTGALVLFTVVFAVFIGLLDAGFKYLFQLMLG